MAEKLREFRYHGPPIYLPAIDRNVEDGDVVKGPASLEANAGFTTAQPEPSRYSKLKKAELLALVAERAIEAPEKATNAAIVELLEAHDQSGGGDD